MPKNLYGTRNLRVVPHEQLATKRHPLVVFKGEQEESENWFATFGGLPGYLGVGFSENEAIENLRETMQVQLVVYDISGSHNLEPTPQNIRGYLNRKAQANVAAELAKGAAQPTKLGAIKTSAIENEARKAGIAKHEVKAILDRQKRWQELGGIDRFVAELGPVQEQQARSSMQNVETFQAFLESAPERARFLLARAKMPRPKSS